MTATLVGVLVERGLIRWDTTVTEAFPDLAEKFHPETSNITMVHLLSHRAGLPANLLWGPFDRKDSLIQQRRKATVLGLSSAPRHAPGSRYEYSNLGYVIAGAMIEKALGVTWEEAIEKEVFKPLGMREWGFGGTGTPGRVDQPWGHTTSDKPVRSNGPDCDNPPVLGPAGRVHCSMGDWTLFVADQLRGARGEPAFLKPETYRKLHSPPFGGEYAMGWVTADRSWGGGAVLNHAGCNTMNYATAWLAPRKGFAVLVCVNQGDDIASKASDEAAGALIRIANAPGALEARP
jgi:CubicO group peptidase (beta-lactamase class C family)